MYKSKAKYRMVVLPTATLRGLKPKAKVVLSYDNAKPSTIRTTASKLKKEGYVFRVTVKGMKNKTIVECLKTPEL